MICDSHCHLKHGNKERTEYAPETIIQVMDEAGIETDRSQFLGVFGAEGIGLVGQYHQLGAKLEQVCNLHIEEIPIITAAEHIGNAGQSQNIADIGAVGEGHPRPSPDWAKAAERLTAAHPSFGQLFREYSKYWLRVAASWLGI